jgi:hypothetical protein
MTAITWKTMEIPSFRDSMQAMPAVGASFNRASDELKGMLTDYNTRQDANWNQGIKNNTNDFIARSQQDTNLNDFYANDSQYSMQGMKDSVGVQIKPEDVLAARLKQEALLSSKAQDTGYTVGRDTFNRTADPLLTNNAMHDSFTASGVKPMNQAKMVSDINTANKDENAVVQTNKTAENTNKLIESLNSGNLDPVLEDAKKFGLLVDKNAIRAAHTALLAKDTEGLVKLGLDTTSQAKDTTAGLAAIYNSGKPVALMSSAAKTFLEMATQKSTPSEQTTNQLALQKLENQANFEERRVAPTTKIAKLTRDQENLRLPAGFADLAAKAVAENARTGGAVNVSTKDVVAGGLLSSILSMPGMGGYKDKATAQKFLESRKLALTSDPANPLSNGEADAIIIASMQANHGEIPWHVMWGDNKEGVNINGVDKSIKLFADNHSESKKIEKQKLTLTNAMAADVTKYTSDGLADDLKAKMALNGDALAGTPGASVGNFHKIADPRAYYGEKAMDEMFPGESPESKEKIKAAEAQIKEAAATSAAAVPLGPETKPFTPVVEPPPGKSVDTPVTRIPTTATPRATEFLNIKTPYDVDIAKAESDARLPSGLLKVLAGTESGFKPDAENKDAVGLFQILGLHGLTKAERLDPKISIKKGAEILVNSIKAKNGDVEEGLYAFKGATTAEGRASVKPAIDDILSAIGIPPKSSGGTTSLMAGVANLKAVANAKNGEIVTPGRDPVNLDGSSPEDKGLPIQEYADSFKTWVDQRNISLAEGSKLNELEQANKYLSRSVTGDANDPAAEQIKANAQEMKTRVAHINSGQFATNPQSSTEANTSVMNMDDTQMAKYKAQNAKDALNSSTTDSNSRTLQEAYTDVIKRLGVPIKGVTNNATPEELLAMYQYQLEDPDTSDLTKEKTQVSINILKQLTAQGRG